MGKIICQARNASDGVIRRYYDEGEQLVSGSTVTPYYYARDHLGSVRDLVDSSGSGLASYDYDPYGQPTRSTASGSTRADYRYAGLFYHAPSGLYLTHYRAYDPVTARWLSRDPVEEGGGVNLYGYVDDSPINRIDPLGLSDVTYDPSTETITVYDKQGNQVGQFPAGNNTASNSKGPWPSGTFPYKYGSSPIMVGESDPNSLRVKL